MAGITLNYPLGNSLARGNHQQKLSDRNQANIRTIDLERQIAAGVGVAMEAVQRYSEALTRSRQSVNAYMTAVENEYLKYSMAMATILDVINLQDRLTDSLLLLVNNHQQYANAIIQLRYEIATLLIKENDRFKIEPSRLVSIP